MPDRQRRAGQSFASSGSEGSGATVPTTVSHDLTQPGLEALHHVLEAGHPAPLDQCRVGGTEGLEQRDRGVRRRRRGPRRRGRSGSRRPRCPTPRPATPCAGARPAVAAPSSAMSPSSASLRSAPDHGRACAAPPRSRPGWRCSSRPGGADRRPADAPPYGRATPSPRPATASTASKGTPHQSAALAAASALGTCCSPCRLRRTSPLPQGVTRVKCARRSSSSTTASARTSASASTAYAEHGAGTEGGHGRRRGRRRS